MLSTLQTITPQHLYSNNNNSCSSYFSFSTTSTSVQISTSTSTTINSRINYSFHTTKKDSTRSISQTSNTNIDTNMNMNHNNKDRTALSVEERIALRVKERDSWSTYTRPSAWKVLKFLCGSIPHYLQSDALLSSEELDQVFPVHTVNYETLRLNKDVHNKRNPANANPIQVTWIGHASLLVQMGGWNILTDPVFSKRCSAVQWAGPERYRPPACTVQNLVEEKIPIDAVLISHNHYDHLDYNSIAQLISAYHDKNGIQFVVPLGLQSWFQTYFPKALVQEIDWHQTCTLSKNKDSTTNNYKQDIEIIGLPMQHWSSRKGYDRDQTLWCGYSVVVTDTNTKTSQKFLFTGDTGYFTQLAHIGSQYGPFDLAAIPIGAYEPRDFMKVQHIHPEEAVQTMLDVQAKKAVPIHWGTFQLTFEPIMEPKERLLKELDRRNIDVSLFHPWFIGDTVSSSS